MIPTMSTRQLYVQRTQEPQPPGIKPPHWTTEDYRSRHLAVYVSYQFSCTAICQGVFPRGGGGRTRGHGTSRGLVCMCVCVCVCKYRGDILIIQGSGCADEHEVCYWGAAA